MVDPETAVKVLGWEFPEIQTVEFLEDGTYYLPFGYFADQVFEELQQAPASPRMQRMVRLIEWLSVEGSPETKTMLAIEVFEPLLPGERDTLLLREQLKGEARALFEQTVFSTGQK